MIKYAVVCQTFGPSGYGLSAAAASLTAHLPTPPATCVSILPREAGEPGNLPIVHLGGNRLDRALRRAPGLVAHLRGLDVRVVHLHGVWTWAVAAIPALQAAGMRVVVSPHGMFEPWILSQNRLRKSVIDALFHRRCIARADAIHALNAHEAAMTRDYLGAAPRRIEIIGNGVEAPTTEPPPAGPPTFLFCGRFDPKKDLHLLLDAWKLAALPDGVLELAGDGDDAYAVGVKERARGMPGVRLLGRVGGAAKATAFARSHVGILTSRSEGQPIALLESLACGRPVIATSGCRLDIGGAAGAPGILAADATGLAEAIRTMAVSGTHARAQACQDWIARHHRWSVSAKRMSGLYDLLTRVSAGG